MLLLLLLSTPGVLPDGSPSVFLRCCQRHLPLLQQVGDLGGATPQVDGRQVRRDARTDEQMGGVMPILPT